MHSLGCKVILPGCDCQDIRFYNVMAYNSEGKEIGSTRLEVDGSTGAIYIKYDEPEKPQNVSVADVSTALRQKEEYKTGTF